MDSLGLIHIYSGEGKGKSTAAIGLSVRATGSGLKVLFAQFMKAGESGELKELATLGVDIIRNKSSQKFTSAMNDEEKEICRAEQKALLEICKEKAIHYDLMVLDEVFSALSCGMITDDDLAFFIKNKPILLELILTGRGAPDKFMELADYVSIVEARKHPYTRGIFARKGIEF